MPQHEPLPAITLTLAVPQTAPEQLRDALGGGFGFDERGLHDPDGRRYEVMALPQDHEFADVVVGGATHPPSEQEVAAMRAAPTLLKVTGPGGSEESAAAMLQLGAALVDAGASGILVDNLGNAHGAHDWQTLAQDADNGGTHWALVSTNRDHNGQWTGFGKPVLFSMGMHCLGFREVIVPMTGDDESDWFHLNNTCGYLQRSGRVPVDGDVMTAMAKGEDGMPIAVPMFRVRFASCEHVPADHPMHNPFGMIRLEPLDPDDPASMDWRPTGSA